MTGNAGHSRPTLLIQSGEGGEPGVEVLAGSRIVAELGQTLRS